MTVQGKPGVRAFSDDQSAFSVRYTRKRRAEKEVRQTAEKTSKQTKQQDRVRPSEKELRAVFASREDCEEKLRAYFEEWLPGSGEVADIEGLADFLGSTRDELIRLAEHRIYGSSIRRARNRIAKIKKQLAFCGKIPAAVLSFDLKNNHGYRDRPEDSSEGSGNTVVFRGKTGEWSK